jgi:hypothetical protein
LPEKLAVDLYGFEDPWIRRLAAECGVAGCVHMHGLVSHQASLAAQRNADVLLFLDWMDERAEGILTGKLFEYLANRRPILGVGVGTATEAARIIHNAGAGETLTQPQEICERLINLPRREAAAAPVEGVSIERYSRLHQADQLLGRIRTALAGVQT